MRRAWIDRFGEQGRYLIVGGCTTAINYVLYFALNAYDIYYVWSNVLAWIGAVAFSYFANGAWVYRAASRRSLREAAAFVASRLFSLALETGLLFLTVKALGVDENLAKILVAVVVVVVNYLTGLVVYKKKW